MKRQELPLYQALNTNKYPELLKKKTSLVISIVVISLICITIIMTYFSILSIITLIKEQRHLKTLELALNDLKTERHERFLKRNAIYNINTTLIKENEDLRSKLYSMNLDNGNIEVRLIAQKQLIFYYQGRVNEVNKSIGKAESMKDAFIFASRLLSQISLLQKQINQLKELNFSSNKLMPNSNLIL